MFPDWQTRPPQMVKAMYDSVDTMEPSDDVLGTLTRVMTQLIAK